MSASSASALPLYEPAFEVPLAAPFWAGIDAHELRLPRCSACGQWQWYPDETGPCCAGAVYEWVPVATTGEIHTFSRVHRSFLPGAPAPVPYVVAFVLLDGVAGPRFVAPVVDDDRVAIGARVAVEFVMIGGRTRPVFVVTEGTSA